MLGGKIVDNFMDKLAEKIGAQEIIRANAQAEAMEAERTKQEAEQFKLQLEELRQNEKEHKAAIEDARASIQETGKTIAALSDRLEQNETQVSQIQGTQHIYLQQVVNRQRDRLYKDNGYSQTGCGLNVLRYGQVRTHTQEEGEYHIVRKDGANKQTNSMFHYLASLSLIER